MRYEKGRKDATRRRIMEIAAKRFREEGVAASGLARIMGDAGLTNGAFYPHFQSKEELVRECMAETQDAQSKLLLEALTSGGLENLISIYLSPQHRDNPGAGCTSAALLAELARQPSKTRRRYTEGLLRMVRKMASTLPSDVRDPEAAVLGIFATLIGTLQLARAVEGAEFSDRILAAGADAARAISSARSIGRVPSAKPRSPRRTS